METPKGYESLVKILAEALNQAANGKGRERHVDGDEPFERQVICELQRRGYDYCRGQAVKKIDESLRLKWPAARSELLGAINYLVAAIVVGDEEHAAVSEAGASPSRVHTCGDCNYRSDKLSVEYPSTYRCFEESGMHVDRHVLKTRKACDRFEEREKPETKRICSGCKHMGTKDLTCLHDLFPLENLGENEECKYFEER